MYKEYKFVNTLISNEIIIDGEMMHISGKYGGSININSIQSIKYTKGNPLLIKKGSLFFIYSGAEIGIVWDPSSLSKYKLMNEQAEEIAAYVQRFMSNKQADKKVIQNITNEISPADEIKKLKELLDMGVITQEEFDTKKKQLLGL